jgi:hypothetical protein
VLKWTQHLDLTTATTKFTAHMFSSPTLADVDADGKMEIAVGTSVGFVYLLDCQVSVLHVMCCRSPSGWVGCSASVVSWYLCGTLYCWPDVVAPGGATGARLACHLTLLGDAI